MFAAKLVGRLRIFVDVGEQMCVFLPVRELKSVWLIPA